jgi:hypothetical protein
MSRRDRHRLVRTIAIAAALLGVAVVCVWAAAGFRSGVLFAIAIGAASAVAMFSDIGRMCSRPLLRRRSSRGPRSY